MGASKVTNQAFGTGRAIVPLAREGKPFAGQVASPFALWR